MDVFLFIIFATVIVCDLLLAVLALRRRTPSGKCLGLTCLGAVLVTTSYLISVLIEEYFWYSVFSSIYFVGIDLTLIVLLHFVRHFVLGRAAGKPHKSWKLLYVWIGIDILVLTINPFHEIAIRYRYVVSTFSHYTYEMLLPYRMHLLLSYTLLVIIMLSLFRKAVSAPSIYRNPYIYSILSLILVIMINAMYLYGPKPDGIRILDYSLLAYSLVAALLYWICFQYMEHGMLDRLRNSIFENLDQGIFLFDYEGEPILKNRKAEEMLACLPLGEHPSFHDTSLLLAGTDAAKLLALPPDRNVYSFQCYPTEEIPIRPMLCDYSSLLSAKGEVLGRLFVLSELTTEFDPLTGFRVWDFYSRLEGESTRPIVAAACDIIGLSDINNRLGRSAGDRAIRALARQMRQYFPEGTVFVRGQEATLIAICPDAEETDIRARLDALQESMNQEKFDGKALIFQSGLHSSLPTEKRNEAVLGALDALRMKKLLDQDSRHSEIVYSLVRALQECDPDTEAHVRRTQKLAIRLGVRIGLTEEQQSNLALLAILHDIGKIGIPLDILNKPGKLSDAEWNVLKTHVEKGYQIANSSEELKGIADMILYHHERWDGKGYPDGLSKESIPLLSRVIAIVDSYDAMLNTRPYRRALTARQAAQELKRCAGTQFDPSLVTEFLALVQEQMPADLSEYGISDGEEADELSDDSVSQLQWSLEAQETDHREIPRMHTMRYSRYIVDSDLTIARADEEFTRLTGYTQEDIRSKKLSQLDLIFEEDRTDYFNLVQKEGEQSSTAYLEHWIRRRDGTAVFVFCYGRKYYDSAERKERVEIIISDSASSYSVQSIIQTEHNKALRRLERWENKFRRDPLTGLLNHEAFKNDVETRLLSGETQALMLMMDVDLFKEYNDTYGHRAGDEFLIMVAQALMSTLRKGDFACRMGGDEFAALLFFPDGVSKNLMMKRAAQICDKINLTLTSIGSGGTSLSMGGAFLEENCRTFDQLYEASDHALYRSKAKGRAALSF